jgi:hypothetical protein
MSLLYLCVLFETVQESNLTKLYCYLLTVSRSVCNRGYYRKLQQLSFKVDKAIYLLLYYLSRVRVQYAIVACSFQQLSGYAFEFSGKGFLCCSAPITSNLPVQRSLRLWY